MTQQLKFGIGPQVPMFQFKRISRLRIKVICTRCGNWFIVDWRKFKKSSHYATRPCPHCFKVSRIYKGQGYD